MGVSRPQCLTRPSWLRFQQNVELFFCLYAARNWNDPNQCNSTSSKLLGFLSAVPGIWRALQCLRRYYDTRNAFPHLVNCGKYLCTILFYVSLSVYRIDEAVSTRAVFIICATVNSIYTCMSCRSLFYVLKLTFVAVWDLAMDWSAYYSLQSSWNNADRRRSLQSLCREAVFA